LSILSLYLSSCGGSSDFFLASFFFASN